ncbi:methionyl-tRNA formyltransferase, partial [Candidatus Gracilibacteria bacterium]|nr:methionyl-tRNA formyltransferase [Candidatus Gracilibacteria bacterium]
MKIAFFGTGDFSKNILADIYKKENIEIVCVVSQPDKPVGRKKILKPTPVHIFANENNIDLFQPKKLKEPIQNPPPNLPPIKGEGYLDDYLKSLDLDFIIVVAYGKIIPKSILDIPKYGCMNIHGSILPAYRGASPIQASIRDGNTKTGLTIMYMSEGMDEGDILKTQEVEIGPDDTSIDIFQKFEEIGPDLLIQTLDGVIQGKIDGIHQDDPQATYCGKISKEDGKIDFHTLSAKEIYARARAYTPWPG